MELSQNVTKPAVSSRLEFSHKEVIQALKKYAESEGYILDDSAEYNFYIQDNYYLNKTYVFSSGSVVGTDKPITQRGD